VRSRPAALLAAAALITLPMAAGCGGLEREPVTVPTVTAPAVTGPMLSATDFRARAEAACTRLFSRLDAIGTPPTTDIAAARSYYPRIAATWNALLDEVGPLRAPDDLAKTWGQVVEAFRTITQNADENVLLADTDREAIEIVNSDASVRSQEAGRFAGARASSIGLGACAGPRR
jgi:hypothetical protein